MNNKYVVSIVTGVVAAIAVLLVGYGAGQGINAAEWLLALSAGLTTAFGLTTVQQSAQIRAVHEGFVVRDSIFNAVIGRIEKDFYTPQTEAELAAAVTAGLQVVNQRIDKLVTDNNLTQSHQPTVNNADVNNTDVDAKIDDAIKRYEAAQHQPTVPSEEAYEK